MTAVLIILVVLYYVFGVYFMTFVFPVPFSENGEVTAFHLVGNMLVWWLIGPILAVSIILDKIVIKKSTRSEGEKSD